METIDAVIRAALRDDGSWVRVPGRDDAGIVFGVPTAAVGTYQMRRIFFPITGEVVHYCDLVMTEVPGP